MHIRHETRYRYERPVKYSVQSLHLTPRRDLSQRALTGASPRPAGAWSRSMPTAISRICSPSRSRTAKSSIVVHGVVETAETEARQDDGPLSPLAYLAPTH